MESIRKFRYKWLTKFFNKVLVEGKIREAWRKSCVIPIFKGKGDVQDCGNYRGIKPLIIYSQ